MIVDIEGSEDEPINEALISSSVNESSVQTRDDLSGHECSSSAQQDGSKRKQTPENEAEPDCKLIKKTKLL